MSGEIVDGDCPFCVSTREECEIQVRALEIDLRQKRSKITRMEREAEKELVAKRDGATWKRILEAWREAFPQKHPSATGIKSARATAVFLRLQSGCEPEDILDAIAGAKERPYVVFGKRQKTGSPSDLADDLQQIMALSRDHEFELLRDIGQQKRAEPMGTASDVPHIIQW